MKTANIRAPMTGTILQTSAVGDVVRVGQTIVIIEAMKMEHELRAEADARVVAAPARAGDLVEEDELLLQLAPLEAQEVGQAHGETTRDPDRAGALAAAASTAMPLRPDLQAVLARHAFTLDAHRPDAVARRHALGLSTARENIAALCDADSFVEYGALAVAAQSRRRSADDLMRNTPADGIVTGIGSINGALFGEDAARSVVMAYDASVLAGTQGMRSHQKTDRMLEIAFSQRLPLVLFAEGGGGRPGDVDTPVVAGLHVTTFANFARLSGRVPVIAIVAGRCFAGNAALAGCSDVLIATRGSNIGMGGPAMVEGGGLGVFAPEEIGPADVQSRNGVIDVLVDDEAEAVAAARRCLAFFQGRVSVWNASEQAAMREALPANRTRVYDMRRVMNGLADADSVLELRPAFGAAILTALARIAGRPIGFLASNPAVLGGAIDADAADKAARFMQLCDARGLPLVSLVDTPGFMVGPEIEARAQVRHVSRMFVAAAHLSVPFFAVVLRKGYGLGAMAMTGGGFHAPVALAAWPSGEFGAMGLEGAVKLGYRKELDSVAVGPERDALYDKLVAEQYARGSALNMAATLEIDAVIDPAETRAWLERGLASAKATESRGGFVDPW